MTAATDYRPRHDWDTVRHSTTAAHLSARLIVVTAVVRPRVLYIGRHRASVSS